MPREARIRLGSFGRIRVEITNCTEAEAAKREEKMREIARDMTEAGLAAEAVPILKKAGAALDAEMFRTAVRLAEGLASGRIPKKPETASPTFRVVAEKWTSGELHRSYPDHVKDKDHDADIGRLEKLYAIDVGGQTLGSVPIGSFTVDHAEAAMASLPKGAKRSASRRHYAQVIHRVLALAVYPLRHIAANPLPKGFLPKIGKPRAHAYLYPDEDRALMACTTVPLGDRLLFGFLDREGPRPGEALGVRWRDLDLARGSIKLDENKTDDPRSWALDPGVVRALAAYKARLGDDATPDAYVFRDVNGGAYDATRLAERLRDALATAGVERPELTENTATRAPIRAHDLRGTFVTLSLANGKTETWVADRTGHKSSQMINRYRRTARSAAELGLGALAPLDVAITELAPGPSGGPKGGPRRKQPTRRNSQNSRKHAERPLGGTVYAGDLKSLASDGVSVRIREGLRTFPGGARPGKEAGTES